MLQKRPNQKQFQANNVRKHATSDVDGRQQRGAQCGSSAATFWCDESKRCARHRRLHCVSYQRSARVADRPRQLAASDDNDAGRRGAVQSCAEKLGFVTNIESFLDGIA